MAFAGVAVPIKVHSATEDRTVHFHEVHVDDGALSLTTMRFHDEVRSTKDVPSASGKSTKPGKKELDAAVALIEALAADWKPERHEDEYRRRLQKVVDRKRKGQTVEVPEDTDEQPSPVPDLMAALEDSLKQAKASA